ncbi:MAG TPA: hypothetical protein VFR02_07950, partial [bacterium]|nr:hypothetical protein [bacterium]
MRALSLSTLAFILMALGAGCGLQVHFTQVSSPRYWAVENKTQAQLNRIQAAAQGQQVPYFLADGLAVNDDLIRRLNGRFRDTSNGAPDISPAQYAFLLTMINGNEQALADILADPAEWEKSFAAQDAFARSDRKPAFHAFNDAARRLRFIIYLNTRLKADAARARALSDAGHISPDQARDLQDNLNDVQNKALEDYQANGALDLTADQIFQLRRMLADAYEPLIRPQGPPAYLGGSFQPGTGFSGGGYTAPGGSYYGGGYQSVGRSYNPPPKTGHPAPTATPT